MTVPVSLNPRTAAYSDGQAVTPNDTAVLPVFDGIMVATAGNVSVRLLSGVDLPLPALQPGVIYWIAGTRIRATGTTASGIVVLR
jgi:hypothetical protein